MIGVTEEAEFFSGDGIDAYGFGKNIVHLKKPAGLFYIGNPEGEVSQSCGFRLCWSWLWIRERKKFDQVVTMKRKVQFVGVAFFPKSFFNDRQSQYFGVKFF